MKASELKVGQAIKGKKGRNGGTVESIKPRKQTVVIVRLAGLSSPRPIRTEIDFNDDVELV